MERFRTFHSSDPELMRYLDGRFSPDFRALPVRSLNVSSLGDQVTFELVPAKHILKIPIWDRLWKLARPETLLLTIVPMVALLAILLRLERVAYRGVALICMAGVLALQLALNLLNDYNDHMRGRDRVNPVRGSRVIQRGWFPAYQVRQMGLVCFGVAIALGLLVVVLTGNWPLLIFAGVLWASIQFLWNPKFRLPGWTEIFAFAFVLLLWAGFMWATAKRFEFSLFILGASFAAIASLYYFLRGFEGIMHDSLSRAPSGPAVLGFDRAQKAAAAFIALVVADLFLFALLGRHPWVWLPLGVTLFHGGYMLRKVWKIRSPLGSDLLGLREQALNLNFSLAVSLVVMFYLEPVSIW